VCCSVLQRALVCFCVLQCVAVCCSACCNVLQCGTNSIQNIQRVLPGMYLSIRYSNTFQISQYLKHVSHYQTSVLDTEISDVGLF